jgi:hypothetical protein
MSKEFSRNQAERTVVSTVSLLALIGGRCDLEVSAFKNQYSAIRRAGMLLVALNLAERQWSLVQMTLSILSQKLRWSWTP